MLDVPQRINSYYRYRNSRRKPPCKHSYVLKDPQSPAENPIYSNSPSTYQKYKETYFRTIFKDPVKRSFSPSNIDPSNFIPAYINCTITKAELQLTIRSLKGAKAAGADEVTNMELKLIEKECPEILLEIILKY